MTEYTAGSAHAGSASVARAHIVGSWVHVTTKERHGSASTALAPDVARAFARGILALADKIDGGEVKETPADIRPKVGDRLRVTESGVWCAGVTAGDVVTVERTCYADDESEDNVLAAGTDGRKWWLPLSAVKPANEPAGLLDEEGLADWEREALKDPAPTPAPSPFARYVEEAKRLLADTDHTGADVIVLARELREQS